MTVILIHGGGWTGGAPSDFATVARGLNANGIKAKSVAYPLTGYIPEQIEFLRALVHDERRNNRKVFAYGQSAGAHIAAILATGGDVDGAILCSPPTNLVNWKFLGVTLTQENWWNVRNMTQELLPKMSPINRLGHKTVPQLILHDRLDEAVPFAQSEAYLKQARKVQKDTRLIVMTEPRGAEAWYHYYPTAKYRAVARRWIQSHK